MTARTDALAPVARWTPGRKAAVLAAIQSGAVTRFEACKAHAISPAELEGWINRSLHHGPSGLAGTKLQVVGR